MKIFTIICELNPFHNGHRYLIEQTKKRSGCDAVLCIMSGSFTQRGEMCIADKFTRAKHAVLGGADCVLELPAGFAVAPAEIFAKGAIKLLSSVPEACGIAFGSETGEKAGLISAAEKLLNEGDDFKREVDRGLSAGLSYVKSYAAAFEACGGDGNLLKGSNDILALEYIKAVKRLNLNWDILPVKRVGGGYLSRELCGEFSSASAIRNNLDDEGIAKSLPSYSYDEVKERKDFYSATEEFERLQRFALLSSTAEEIKKVYGCTEGLENRLKQLCNLPYDQLLARATGKRYATARIRRILCANLLKLYASDCDEYLNSRLYLKPLAVKREKADEILAALAKSDFPLIIKQRDMNALSPAAKRCLERSSYADGVWGFINGRSVYDFTLINV